MFKLRGGKHTAVDDYMSKEDSTDNNQPTNDNIDVDDTLTPTRDHGLSSCK